MAQQQQMHMPGVFGGLMRYDEEFKSNFMLSPMAVIAFIVAIIVFVIILKVFFPVTGFAFPFMFKFFQKKVKNEWKL